MRTGLQCWLAELSRRRATSRREFVTPRVAPSPGRSTAAPASSSRTRPRRRIDPPSPSTRTRRSSPSVRRPRCRDVFAAPRARRAPRAADRPSAAAATAPSTRCPGRTPRRGSSGPRAERVPPSGTPTRSAIPFPTDRQACGRRPTRAGWRAIQAEGAAPNAFQQPSTWPSPQPLCGARDPTTGGCGHDALLGG
jgi:hypothetical protein